MQLEIHTNNRVLFFIFLLASSIEDDADATVEADDLLINEGDLLEIKCTGLERISFIYPEDLNNAASF